MRISNLYIKQTSIDNTLRNTEQMTNVQKKMLTQKKNLQPSDNLNDTITSLYQRVRISQIDQYQKNITTTQSFINVAHDKLKSFSEITTQVRTLAVQAANGVISQEQHNYIAGQVEELLGEMINLANAQYEDNYIFSGNKTDVLPFRVTQQYDPNFGREKIASVEYIGDRLELKRRIGNDEKISIANSGAEVFWAQNYTVTSSTNSQNYVSPRDQKIMIDGYAVEIDVGDNINTIINKINDTVPSVRAFSQEWPTGETALAIESTFPKKVAIEDIEGGTLLRELGILKLGPRGNAPYDNIRESAVTREGSIFEVAIRLRNSILEGRIENIGGRDLGAIDDAHKNLIKAQSQLSSTQQRIGYVEKDLDQEKEYVVLRKSQAEDVDMVQAAIDYNEWSNVHRIALQTAAKLIRPSLLDFM